MVTLAIVLNAVAYKKVTQGSKSTKGIVLSLVAGLLMSFFYRFVADSVITSYSIHYTKLYDSDKISAKIFIF